MNNQNQPKSDQIKISERDLENYLTINGVMAMSPKIREDYKKKLQAAADTGELSSKDLENYAIKAREMKILMSQPGYWDNY